VRGYTHESPAVAIRFAVAAAVAPRVVSDPALLRRMLLNYLCNARKFTTHGAITTTVDLVPATAATGDAGGAGGGASGRMLRVSVADTGPGVDPADAGLLFRPFAQLRAGAGGAGLGLHSVREMAAALGGTAGHRPNRPRGAEFWFEVPYVPAVDSDGSDGSDGSDCLHEPDGLDGPGPRAATST
jgi:signal transduction histidine kinase